MIRLTMRDRGTLAGILKIHAGTATHLEAFDLVDTVMKFLNDREYSVVSNDVMRALNAAAAQVVDPTNHLLPLPDRSVVVPHLRDLGWKEGEAWRP